MTAGASVLPMGEPLAVEDVIVGGALSDGSSTLLVFVGGGLTAAVVWESIEEAERHLAAALADVRSRMPLPPVAEFPVRAVTR